MAFVGIAARILHLADRLCDFDVARQDSEIGVADDPVGGIGPLADIGDFGQRLIEVDAPHQILRRRAPGAEGAAERTAAIGLEQRDHPGGEEFIEIALQIRRGQVLDDFLQRTLRRLMHAIAVAPDDVGGKLGDIARAFAMPQHKFGERLFAAIHDQVVDVIVLLEEGEPAILGRVDIRSAGNDQRIRQHAAHMAADDQIEILVPAVIREADNVGTLLLDRGEKTLRMLEQADIHAVAQRIHCVGLDVADAERGRQRAVRHRMGVGQIGQHDLGDGTHRTPWRRSRRPPKTTLIAVLHAKKSVSRSGVNVRGAPIQGGPR